MSEDHREPIFHLALEGSRLQIQKLWHQLKIFKGVMAVIGENKWDRGVCWENLGGALVSNNGGASDLMETVGVPAYVAYIWSGLTLVETDSGARAESCGSGKGLLDWDRCLLDKFGRGPRLFGIFGLGSMLVEEVNALIGVPGEDMPCGYVGSR